MLGLIGRKIGMSQVFDKDGVAIPVSVIEAGPCPVVQVKHQKTDGYNAVQIGFGAVRHTRAGLPRLGHFRKANLPPYRYLQEFKVDDPEAFSPGQLIDVGIFKDAKQIDVSGKSKGRGFQGVIKRHGFSRGRETHGGKSHRVPGSIGMAAYPGRVLKGQKLPGRMGQETIHVKNLQVVEVDLDNNLLLVKGAVPGARNTLLRITTSS
ncbi:MAG: 50S ribosomal protein L3 [Candidatus Krumholzibacteriota bacterium]|nr:50S ribosomal protein L3 [Candidatus Krumholzibacteriota bacterium]